MFRRLPILLAILFFILPGYAWNAFTSTSNVISYSSINNNNSFYSISLKLYHKINDSDLDFDAFKYGLKGYLKLQNDNKLGNSNYLTIIDMSASSNKERLFIVNMETQQLEHKSLVSHGRNSGLEFAKQFSNEINSHQTSLGFYKTAETYHGKHGFSLRLDGLEYSNDKARKRAVVIHEANYANKEFIKKNGRLGRSYGCPSLPQKDYTTIINKIKKGSLLFIYYPQTSYLKNSKIVNSDLDLQGDFG
jgi:hypothetical protein